MEQESVPHELVGSQETKEALATVDHDLHQIRCTAIDPFVSKKSHCTTAGHTKTV